MLAFSPPQTLQGEQPRESPQADKYRSMRVPVRLHELADTPGAIAKPFFTDPYYNGSCDPEAVWNPVLNQWFVYYTARRATRKKATYVGTAIGVVSSPNLLKWTFRGYCGFDGKLGKPDNENTHWAPGVIVAGNRLHMFATYKDSAKPPWGGAGVIRHYSTSLDDPVSGWKLEGVPDFRQPDPIDVSLLQYEGRYHAYYRVGKGGGIQWATSIDLVHWENQGPCLGDVNSETRGFGYQEAPYVFRFSNAYWMLTDPHEGLAVFRSDDAVHWTQAGRILKEDGNGPRDTSRARHPSVCVTGGKAYIFYHVEPNRPYPNPPAEKRTVDQKLSYLQIAELTVRQGRLVCERDRPVVRDSGAIGRWSKERANRWYAGIDWPVGANFVPSTAVNQLEMWQAESYDPETIDRELGWAASIGMNTMRVFLHDLAWNRDPDGFLNRMDEYLAIADRHGIRTMFVFFDGVWDPYPQAGRQTAPAPRIHNSGWVQSPGRKILESPDQHASLEAYVTAVVERFRDDDRVLAWDLFNEPDNSNQGNYGGDSRKPDISPGLKSQRALELMSEAFRWARDARPSQPLTAGVWGKPDWLTDPDLIETFSLLHSDVITFHTYDGPLATRELIGDLQKYGRPILCTEYPARAGGSTFEAILPLFHRHRVGACNWGLVNGKTNTIYPWDSWRKSYSDEPALWHHDVLRQDGTPYRTTEVELIKELSQTP
ncbi:endo-1,4-beta-xylanase [Rhodopirellula sallentina]|uniref:endo-1,4-beta-xylanase n=1 Tax=Rhodopirellula sallentina TaxID=1263869 RepID=UPI001360B180|nr:endo-1,4-beta-xylanase [Rhodopirellula sallentina]